MDHSDEEEYDCPLCMEEFDIADRNFRPCPCGYQICRFCWHHIRENLNGKCPACRREYTDQNAEFQPISADEIQRIRREKKEKERQQKDIESANRTHLANMRVVQKNLVYIIGLHPRLATEDIIRSNDYFGQFGKIAKIVINKRQIAPTSHANGVTSMQPSAAVYVTYFKKDDAQKAIHAVDGSVMMGRILRASYGTTKYCTYYLRNMSCPNPSCLYLHEPGEEADTISKEELATGKHRMRDQVSHDDDNIDDDLDSQEDDTDYPVASSSYSNNNKRIPTTIISGGLDSALPATASWGKSSAPSTPKSVHRTLTPDAFGPPLSAAVAGSSQQQQQQKQPLSPNALKRKLEKKKRKELLKQKKEEEERQRLQQEELAKQQVVINKPQQEQQQEPTTFSSDEEDEEEEEEEEEEEPVETIDPLTHFVLGSTFQDVCTPPKYQDDMPVGILGLTNDQQQPLVNTVENELQKLNLNDMSPLEYLSQNTPTPVYSGSFNPFSHNMLRNAGVLNDPPRKHSRFGFAQF
ncbi:hypothetical protein K501DRAFT_336280 [Backusella circina FSU 941]|nr:hypothetical protein K501DRAFT_336280 [Backusella circina FSU 941]